MTRFVVVLLLGLLAGCGSQGLSYDKEVDDLGARIVANLTTLPMVTDATYRYDHGVDFGQRLRLRIILNEGDATPASAERVIDHAARDFWLSPAAVGHLVITVYSAANPPTGDTDSDTPNADRAIATKNIEDAEAFDRPEMERKYGPRPTR